MSGYRYETSAPAFDSIQLTLGKKQKEVMRALLSGPKTNQEIADFLGLPINTITPRCNELVKRGMVEEMGKKVGFSGRWAIVWGLSV